MVLRGWGATCLLRPVPHVVCVRVTRSLAKRVEWLMADLDTDDAEFAEAEIRRSDDAHAARMHEQFGVTWGDPVLYDLVLNTDRLSVDSCVEQIAQLVRRPEFAETRRLARPAGRHGAEGARAGGVEGPRGDARHQHHDRGQPGPRHAARHRVSNAEERAQAEEVAAGGGRRRRTSTTS